MKIRSVIALLVFCVLNSYAQHADFSFKRKIENIAAVNWYNIALPAEMVPHVKNNFDDMRLYNIHESDTTEIPYLLKITANETKEEKIQLPILNKSRKNDALFFTVDTKGKVANYVDLDFSQKNFNAFVKIEGSHDQLEWFEIVDGQRILSIQSETVEYAVQKVKFPPSNYRYLRVSVRCGEPLTLINASFRHRSFKAGLINNYTSSFAVTNDPKLKQSIIDITLSQLSLINKISVVAESDMDYYRPFTLEYLSDSSKTTKGWVVFYSSIGSGYLTSVDSNDFDLELTTAKKLRLTVSNNDNAPLKIQSIKLSGPKVFLTAKLKTGNNFIFYGSKKADAPAYDLSHFEKNIPDSLATLSVESEETISKPSTAATAMFNSKTWLWLTMVVVIGVLGLFTLRMIRNN
jgi:hypothetical protein